MAAACIVFCFVFILIFLLDGSWFYRLTINIGYPMTVELFHILAAE